MTKTEAAKILNLPEDASLDVLRETYNNLMHIYHPYLIATNDKKMEEKYHLINEAYEVLAASKGRSVNATEESKAIFISYINEYIHRISSFYSIIDADILNYILKYLIEMKVKVNNCKDSLTLEHLIKEFKNKMQEYAQIYFDKMVDQKVNSMIPAIYALILKYLEEVKAAPDVFAAYEIVQKMFKAIATYYARYNNIRSMLDIIIQKYELNDYVKDKLPNLEDECLKKIAVTLNNGNIYPIYDEFEEELQKIVATSKVTSTSVLNDLIDNYRKYVTSLNLGELSEQNKALEATEVLKIIIEFLSNTSRLAIDPEKLLFFENVNWSDLNTLKQQLLEEFGPSLEFENCDIYVSRDVPSFFYNGMIKVFSNNNGTVEYTAAPNFIYHEKMSEHDLTIKYISLKELLLKSQFVGKAFERTAPTVNNGSEFIKPSSPYFILYFGKYGALLANFQKQDPFCTISPEYLVDGKYVFKEIDADLSKYFNKYDTYRQITDFINRKVSRNGVPRM